MTNEKNRPDPNDMQELLIFKGQKSQKTQKQESISLEYVDQEDKIKLTCELTPFGGMYRYALLVFNESSAPITEVKIRVRYPDFLVLSRSTPPTIKIDSTNVEEEKQIKIEYEELKADSKKQINLFFAPTNLDERGEIKSYVTFVNNADFVRALDSEPVPLEFDPISIERKIIPSSEISKFLQKSNLKRAIKSVGIGNDKDFDISFYFNQVEQTIQDQGFQLITKDLNRKIAWYYGTELVSGADVLVIGQIMYSKIEWIASSKNPFILISLLTEFLINFTKRMLMRGMITSKNQVCDLECKYCGNILPIFPKKSEPVECKKCNYEQIVWK